MGAKIDHATRSHALLSASGATRWMNCTPSARMEEGFEEPPSSDFAAEGTLAHEFGDLGLQLATKQIKKFNYTPQVAKLRKDRLYTEEMEPYVQEYIDYCMGSFNIAKQQTPDALMLIEERVDLTEWVPESFGTNDDIVIADGTMEVIDLKYGKGLRVDADDNPQLMLYGLGALRKHEFTYGIHTVKLTIVQPRLDHISSWTISADDLNAWGVEQVEPKAKLAFAGEGECKAGSWCRWCKAKAKCAALATEATSMAKKAFSDPKTLTDEEVLEAYSKIATFTDWAASVSEYVKSEALKGKKWDGYKLVAGRSNRKWVSDEKVIDILKSENYKNTDYLATKLKGIGAIEKLVTKAKFNGLFGDVVEKPEGKPTLVEESDKRQELNTNESAKQAFA